MIRRSVSLKTVDADFSGSVQVPTRISPEWFDMAVIALSLSAKELVSALGGRRIETACRGLRPRKRERIEL